MPGRESETQVVQPLYLTSCSMILQEILELCDESIYQQETSNSLPSGPSAVRSRHMIFIMLIANPFP